MHNSVVIYNTSEINNPDITNSKNVSTRKTRDELLCNSSNLRERNMTNICITPKQHAICNKHNSTALFTCKNDHYMGTDIKCIGKVCNFCITVSRDIKELLPYVNNVFCAACVREITNTPSIKNVTS